MNTPRTGSRLLTWLLAFVALFVLVMLLLSQGLMQIDPSPFSITIDGDEVFDSGMVNGLVTGHWLAVCLGLTIATFVVLVVVPLVLIAVSVLVGVVLLLAIGGPLLAVTLVFALLLSPLILIGVLAWWLLRKPARRSATVAG